MRDTGETCPHGNRIVIYQGKKVAACGQCKTPVTGGFKSRSEAAEHFDKKGVYGKIAKKRLGL